MMKPSLRSPVPPTLLIASICMLFILKGLFFDRSLILPKVSFRDELIWSMNERGLNSTWSSIYVINMASRPDRKRHMELVAQALDLKFTFVDAILSDSPAVNFVMERLDAEHTLENKIREGDELAQNHSEKPTLYEGQTWREYVLSSLTQIHPSYPVDGTKKDLGFNYPFWPPYAPIACYLSHLKTWQLALQNDDDNILILEDDIDAEFSLVDRWNEMMRSLTDADEGWDIIYLGWILGDERVNKPTFHPGLRKANRPMGTHAYSLSRRGLRRILGHVHTLPGLFSSPVDHDLPFKYLRTNDSMGAIQGYSATPALVVPFVALGSDIGGGASESWGGLLTDSTVERIMAFQGQSVPKKTQENIWKMWSIDNI